MIRPVRLLFATTLGSACFTAFACSSDPGTPAAGGGGTSSTAGAGVAGSQAGAVTTGGAGSGTGGSTGTSGTFASGGIVGSSGTNATAGSGGTAAGTGGTAGAGGSGGTGGAGAGGTGGAGGTSGSGTGGSGGALTGTPATCKTPTPSPNAGRAIECDYLLQSIDFEDKLSYPSPPASIKITNYGKAMGQTAINNCSPICYSKNLTVGIDIVGGQDDTLKGEVIAEYPATGGGLPITAADGNRNILAWITFDGAAKPDFEIDVQLVLETSGGVVPSVENKAFFKAGGNLNPFGPFSIANDYSYKNGGEFKYFGATGAQGFPTAPANVTGIGFRITAKATAGQSWHGVAYIDHLQVRAPTPNNPTDAGAYPYGLN